MKQVMAALDARLLAAVLAAIVSVCVLAGPASADGDPATDAVSRTFPYQGRLDLDGVAVTGEMPVLFEVYDADAVDPEWTERQTVAFHAGRFLVLLGACDEDPADAKCPDGDIDPAAQLVDMISAGDDLQLSVTLEPAAGAVVLASRKRFHPVPYAHWASVSADFSVGHDLAVANDLGVTGNATLGGDLGVGGSLSAGSATISQNATVNGNLTVAGSIFSSVRLVASSSTVSNGTLLCDDDEVPIGHTVSCWGTGHGLWAVKYVRSGNRMGIRARCWAASGAFLDTWHASLLCAKIGTMPAVSYPNIDAWNW